MAIEAKASLLKQLEKKLSGITTADTMAAVLSATADIVEMFDIRELFTHDDGDDMMESFLEAMNVQSRSKKTIAHYKGVLGNMMSEVGVSTRKITVYHLRSWLSRMKEKGLKDSTLNHYREVLSSYFGWLHREGLIESNPVANLGTIKVPKVDKKTFSDIDMEKLRQGCSNVRDRAIVSFLASTGCRVGELTELNIGAVDMNKLECVVHGKGNKERTVYIDSVTAMYLRKYLSCRQDENDALFLNRYGKRFDTGGIRDVLKRLEARTKVEHVHPHKFRRTLATNLAKRGMAIQDISAILGHDSIATSMAYVMLDREDVKNKFRHYYAP